MFAPASEERCHLGLRRSLGRPRPPAPACTLAPVEAEARQGRRLRFPGLRAPRPRRPPEMAEHRFHTPEPVELEIKVPIGDIDIETVDGDESFISLDGDEKLHRADRGAAGGPPHRRRAQRQEGVRSHHLDRRLQLRQRQPPAACAPACRTAARVSLDRFGRHEGARPRAVARGEVCVGRPRRQRRDRARRERQDRERRRPARPGRRRIARADRLRRRERAARSAVRSCRRPSPATCGSSPSAKGT